MKKLDVSIMRPGLSLKSTNILKKEIIPGTNNFQKQFLDLLKKIFIYDANKRISAKDALRHPWFRESQNDEGAEAARIRMENEAARSLPNQQEYW